MQNATSRERIQVFILLLALALPLLWPSLPPLIDLPGHVGRYHIQFSIDRSPDLQRFFAVERKLLPNMGVDLLVQGLAPLIGVAAATKLIVLLIPVLTGAGMLMIAREIHGRIPAPTIFALALAFHYPFQFGFVNFSLGMGLALLGLGLWLRLGRFDQYRVRALLFAGFAPLVYLCHVSAWGALGVLIFSAEFATQLANGKRWFAAAVTAAILCVPMALPAAFIIGWGNQSGGGLSDWFNVRIIVSWIVTIMRSHWQAFDLGSGIVLYLVAAAPALFRRFLRYDLRLLLPALALGTLAIVMPNIVSSSFFAGVRLIPFAVVLALLAIDRTAHMPGRATVIFRYAALAFLALRVSAQTVDYAMADMRNRIILGALDRVDRGARIATMVGQRCGRWEPSRHLHLPELAALKKDAFTNGHWQIAGQQVITVRYTAGAPIVSDQSQFVTVSGCTFPTMAERFATIPLSAFDYLWVVEVPVANWPRDSRLQPIWQDGQSVLYRIIR